MAWYVVKHRDNFTITFALSCSQVLITLVQYPLTNEIQTAIHFFQYICLPPPPLYVYAVVLNVLSRQYSSSDGFSWTSTDVCYTKTLP